MKEFEKSKYSSFIIHTKKEKILYNSHSQLDIDMYEYRMSKEKDYTFSLMVNFDFLFWIKSLKDQNDFGILGDSKYDPNETGYGCPFAHLHESFQ